ncbi:hypothetical protein EWB00_009743, partial [Schistosoma japonicum]
NEDPKSSQSQEFKKKHNIEGTKFNCPEVIFMMHLFDGRSVFAKVFKEVEYEDER